MALERTGDAAGRDLQSEQPTAHFVGRARELEELRAGLTALQRGSGRLFLISGEPGIGKTSLADRICAEARARGANVAWGRCWEDGDAPPYWPWIQVLRAVVANAPAPLRAAAAELSGLLEGTRAPAGALLRELAPEESELGRFALFDSIASLLRRAGAPAPLLVVLDDLHAADEASLLLLRFIAHDLRTAPLMVIGTYRESEVRSSAQHRELLGLVSRDARNLPLRGLSDDDVDKFVRAAAGGAPGEAAVQLLSRRTGGNPFFLGELVRLLIAEGQLGGARGVRELRIPDTVRAAIRRRLAALPDDSAELLRSASALGVEFDVALLRKLTGLELSRTVALLEVAAARDVVVVDAARGTCRFAHALIADTIHDDIDPVERRSLHHRIAEAIEELHRADLHSHLAEIAHHFAMSAPAADWIKAIDYMVRAAHEALSASAYEEAARLYRAALRELEHAGADDEELRYQILMGLGDALRGAGLHDQCRSAFEQAAVAARKLKSPDKLVRAALGRASTPTEIAADERLIELLEEALEALGARDPGARARMLARLAVELYTAEADARIPPLVEEAAELAQLCGDAHTQIHVLYCTHIAIWSVDNLDKRIAVATEAIEIAERIGDKFSQWRTRLNRLVDLLETGDLQQADADLKAFCDLTEQLRLPFGWKELALAERALMEGRLEEGEKFADAALEIGRRMERRYRTIRQAVSSFFLVLRREQGRIAEVEPAYRRALSRTPGSLIARCALAYCMAEMDRREAARTEFEYLAAAGFDAIAHKHTWYPAMALLAEVCCYLHDADRAARLYALMLPYAERNVVLDLHVCFGPMARYLGMLASVMKRFDEAEAHLRAALAMNRRMASRQWLAHTHFDYAALLLQRARDGDRGEAVKQLDAAIEIASACGMSRLAERAFALRSESSIEPIPAADVVTLRREGELWAIGQGARLFRVKDLRGLAYIQRLISHPHLEIHALDLLSGSESGEPGDDRFAAERALEGGLRSGIPDDAGEMLDATAKAAYRQRLDELRDQLDDARELSDTGRASQLEDEIDALSRELARAVGLGGRSRRAASASERARISVTRAIKAAVEKVGANDAELGRRLARTIRTGTYCVYVPDPRRPISPSS